jgi:hypothetical protein
MMRVHHDTSHSLAGEVSELTREQRLAVDLDQDLRHLEPEWAQPGSSAGGKDDRIHFKTTAGDETS